ncbi:MAG: hypothetical protein O3B24_07550, partial [Verrucomicrobia bacterium]|nr:hypothetical protein [Verrucomicrobiota bacterium]
MTTKQNSATGVTRWLGIAVALAVANSATAATTTATSWNTVNTVGQSTVTFNGGQVSTSLPYPGFPTPVRVELAAQATIGSFAGDYRRAGVQALNLTLACNTTPVNAFIMLYGNSGRLWATSALTNGANSISFDREAGGWALYGAGADLPTLWNEDLNN